MPASVTSKDLHGPSALTEWSARDDPTRTRGTTWTQCLLRVKPRLTTALERLQSSVSPEEQLLRILLAFARLPPTVVRFLSREAIESSANPTLAPSPRGCLSIGDAAARRVTRGEGTEGRRARRARIHRVKVRLAR